MKNEQQSEKEQYQVIEDEVIVSDFRINIKNRKILEDPIQSSKSKRVYTNCTISFVRFKEMAVIEKCLFLNCHIISMKVFNKSGKEDSPHFEKCIFYGCRIDSMKVTGLNHADEISFINCKVKDLDIKEAAARQMKFIGCEIKHSKFIYSNLPNISFSEFESKKAKAIINEVINNKRTRKQVLAYTSKLPAFKSLIFRSKFLFCELNKISIGNTHLLETAIKHCHLESLKIPGENSLMSDVDIRGTKMFNPNFGRCELKNVRTKKGVLIPQLVGDLRGMFTRGGLLLKHLKGLKGRRERGGSFFRPRDEKELITIAAWRKASRFTQSFKKILYKIRLGFLADILSSTDIKKAEGEKANLSNAPFFAQKLKEFELIDHLESNHLVFSSFFYITSNYMRSFTRLIFVSLVPIFFFSFVYAHHTTFNDELQSTRTYKYECIDKNNRPTAPLYLSVEVFFSGSTYPLTPSNTLTKIIIPIEKIFGYGVLVSFLSILLAPFSTGYLERKKREEMNKKGAG